MGKKGRKFIDKKSDVIYSFHVGARSQRDPLIADETAPQGVLIDDNPQDSSSNGAKQQYGLYFDDDYDYLKHIRSTREGINWDDEELQVYEIRKEDPQANKKEFRKKGLTLPSSAFESFVEEPIGLLNRAAPVTGPCPELDPDVVAQLDDSYQRQDDLGAVENILSRLADDDGDDEWMEEDEEDNEIWGAGAYGAMMARGTMTPLEELDEIEYCPEVVIKQGKDVDDDEDDDEEDGWSTTEDVDSGDCESNFNVSDDEGECGDHVGPMRGFPTHIDDEDTKSHFTEYSLTSSVVRRNKHLTDLDDQFQAMFIREYAEEQIGALDGEDIDGFVDENSLLYQQALKQTKKQFEKESNVENEREWIVNWIKDQREKIIAGELPEHESEEIEIEYKVPDKKWDCQSVLSTYSNIYNHPATLDRPKRKILINPATGLPVEQGEKGLTKKALALHDGDNSLDNADLDTQTLISTISAISYRPPGETPKERQARKSALKELRRERRIEKKMNQLAFKDEKKRQERINMNKSNIVKVV